MTSILHLNTDYLTQAYKSGISGYRLSKELRVSLWVILDRLRKAGVVIRPSGTRKKLHLALEDATILRELTDGLLLGDGSISAKKPHLRIEQSNSRFGWLEDLQERFQSIGVRTRLTSIPSRVRIIEGREVVKTPSTVLCTPVCNEFRAERDRWYPCGKKRVPKDICLTPLSLAQWLSGDGVSRPEGGLELCTNGFLQEDVELLVSELYRQTGVRSTVGKTPRKGQFKLHILRKSEAVRFRDLVKPYMSRCCLYKLERVRPAIRWKKLSDEAASKIRALRKEGLLLKDLGQMFGVGTSTISLICQE